MKIQEIIGQSYSPPDMDVGDLVRIGKFKNRKATVTGFSKDGHNQPVLKTDRGDQKLFKPRIAKLEEQDRNEAFARWFGASKIVDGNGKPLVVYHGAAREFEVFLPQKGERGDGCLMIDTVESVLQRRRQLCP